MNCPKCKSAASVIDSRKNERNTRRRLVCDSCGERFTTYEFIRTVESITDPNSVEDIAKECEDLKKERAKLVDDIRSLVNTMEMIRNFKDYPVKQP